MIAEEYRKQYVEGFKKHAFFGAPKTTPWLSSVLKPSYARRKSSETMGDMIGKLFRYWYLGDTLYRTATGKASVGESLGNLGQFHFVSPRINRYFENKFQGGPLKQFAGMAGSMGGDMATSMLAQKAGDMIMPQKLNIPGMLRPSHNVAPMIDRVPRTNRGGPLF